MRGGCWAAHTFSGSMNSSPNPLSFIQLELGAGGRKEGALLCVEHVDSGLVPEGGSPPFPHGPCPIWEAESYQALADRLGGRPALFLGPWSLAWALCFYRQDPKAGKSCFGAAGWVVGRASIRSQETSGGRLGNLS